MGESHWVEERAPGKPDALPAPCRNRQGLAPDVEHRHDHAGDPVDVIDPVVVIAVIGRVAVAIAGAILHRQRKMAARNMLADAQITGEPVAAMGRAGTVVLAIAGLAVGAGVLAVAPVTAVTVVTSAPVTAGGHDVHADGAAALTQRAA